MKASKTSVWCHWSSPIPHLINETLIADLLTQLLRRQDNESAYFWLLYARITEAAIICAANYADNCEYSAAGDLLVNPRRILVNRTADPTGAELKHRHGAISQQFNQNGANPVVFRKTFSVDRDIQIEEPALLPMLADTITQSGVFCEKYLYTIEDRMKKIADTITFLSAWSLDDARQLHQRLSSSTPDSKQFILSNLCRFDLAVYDELGAELDAIASNRWTTSAFLKKPGLKDGAFGSLGIQKWPNLFLPGTDRYPMP